MSKEELSIEKVILKEKEISQEEAIKIIQDEQKKSIQKCSKDIQEVLKKHGMTLKIVQSIEIQPVANQ